jgi:hypothetical protein
MYGRAFDYFAPDEVGAGGLNNTNWTKGKDPQPVQAIVIIPTGPYKAIDGETRIYSFQTFSEEGESTGNEVSVEVYATMEGGVSIPMLFATFSGKVGEKIATKTFKKQESKTATRAGMQISKSFLVQKVRQRVMAFNASIVDDTGFLVQRKDGGDSLGPFWPIYTVAGAADLDRARTNTDAAVDELIQATAADLVYRYRR